MTAALRTIAAAPILAAKITAPGVPDWAVPRPRITRLIEQGRRWCPLTVITAPAGAGKTMTLALWAASEPGPVAWIGLDTFDNRPGLFWAYVAAALRRSGVAAPEPPPAGRGPDAGRVFVLGLTAALAAQDPPLTLVLDDLTPWCLTSSTSCCGTPGPGSGWWCPRGWIGRHCTATGWPGS